MVVLTDEKAGRAANATRSSDDLIHSRQEGTMINAYRNTTRGHSPGTRRGAGMTDTRALRRALYSVISATYAIEDGDKAAAVVELTEGAKPAARAYPLATKESYALTIVFGSVIVAAAA